MVRWMFVAGLAVSQLAAAIYITYRLHAVYSSSRSPRIRYRPDRFVRGFVRGLAANVGERQVCVPGE